MRSNDERHSQSAKLDSEKAFSLHECHEWPKFNFTKLGSRHEAHRTAEVPGTPGRSTASARDSRLE